MFRRQTMALLKSAVRENTMFYKLTDGREGGEILHTRLPLPRSPLRYVILKRQRNKKDFRLTKTECSPTDWTIIRLTTACKINAFCIRRST